jgi:phenylacetic acid degradation operon negative regulatory protein
LFTAVDASSNHREVARGKVHRYFPALLYTNAHLHGGVPDTLKDEPPRSKSLIVTIFGDSIVPQASEIWLSELIELLKPFSVNERLVRTSAFRLAEEGWLESQREGRRSRYSLTPSGKQRVEHAYHRIYDPPSQHWKGTWTIVILSKTGNQIANRAELRRELE